MDSDGWRITVEVQRQARATSGRRTPRQPRSSRIGSRIVQTPSWTTLYAYGSTREEVERVVSLIRSALQSLQIIPVSFVIDEWLPLESRWSGDGPPGRFDTGGGSWIDALLSGLDYPFPP